MVGRTDDRLIVLAETDTVAVVRAAIAQGERVWIGGEEITLERAVTMGHKLARMRMKPGDKVLKYGVPIGSVTEDITVGAHVHLHNMKSDYTPTYALDAAGDVT